MYFLAQLTNVVYINTFVVFVRLYWFEKRFQHVVREAMSFRRTRSRSRTNTQDVERTEEETEKRGVDGRDIVVLGTTGRRFGQGADIPTPGEVSNDPESSSNSSEDKRGDVSSDSGPDQTSLPTPITRNITFADDVAQPLSRSLEDRVPQEQSTERAEKSIAFLQRQRDPNDNETLRIPGPRESDRGQVPETLRDEDNVPLSPDGDGQDRHITFPDVELTRTGRSNMPGLSFPRTGTARSQGASSTVERAPGTYRLRRNSGTFTGVHRTNTTQSAAPYLSWQPTVGRNSAFVDLTEKQREELGGIEYRSLKLLAIILVCKCSLIALCGSLVKKLMIL